VNRFMNLDDLSASEDDMDIEDDDDAASTNGSPTDGQEGRHKIARVQPTSRADGDSVPKWSNPDPYTVLPPPNEVTGKKRDFVQLIRKAKNDTAEKLAAGNPVASNDDFISFGDDDDEEQAGPVQPTIPPPPPPRGLRPLSPPPPPPPPEAPSTFVGSLNDVAATRALAQSSRNGKRSAQTAGLPEQPQHQGSKATKRKRGQYEGGITADWLPDPYSNPAPWCKNDSYAPNISKRPVSDYEKMIML
jgi:non-canonical poly(A) RNA polymerase PAPD5/7